MKAVEAGTANRIRQRWDIGEPAIVGWLQVPSAIQAEALAALDFDGLVIDLQHSAIDFAAAVSMLQAIEGRGCEPLVRLQSNNFAEIGKLLDCGAYGLIAPLIDDADQARQFAEAIHYPPAGRRSFGPRRPLLRFPTDYPAQAAASIISLAMIETRGALDNLDIILAVPGIDGVFVGPADLALALGKPPLPNPSDPEVRAAISLILERARAAGKRAGIFCTSPQFAAAMLDEGFDLVTAGADLALLTDAARHALQEIRAG